MVMNDLYFKDGQWEYEKHPVMEIFINNNGSCCVVLERQGDIALIALPNNEVTPYVVPMSHIAGNKSWNQGCYFRSLETAFNNYKERTNE